MEKDIEAKAVEILSSIQVSVGQFKDFAIDQLPDIVSSYIMYGRAYHTTMILIGIIFVVISILWIKYAFKKANLTTNFVDRDGWHMVGTLGGIVGIFISFLTMGIHFSSTLLVWFAPKIWLIKELASIIK